MIFEPPIVTRPHDKIIFLFCGNCRVNLLISRYISVFGVIFNILVDILVGGVQDLKNIF